jgi:putative transposase
MKEFIRFLFSAVSSTVRSRLSLQMEIAALRYQLSVYQRSVKRPRVKPADRILWSCIAKAHGGWKAFLVFVQPRTVTEWQKRRFRDHWRSLSQSCKPGRPAVPREVRDLIRRISKANPDWGSPRIVGELGKLGIEVAQSTVDKYRVRLSHPPSPSWRAFLKNHVKDLVSIDFFIVPTVGFKVLFVLVVLSHHRRRIVHFNVTENPTAEWTAQQIVEAFPYDTAPKYLLRDRDKVYGSYFQKRVCGMGIEEVLIAPRSPWQNPYAERVIGSIRRECLDSVIVLNKRHLKRTLTSYFDYYHRWRTHLSLDMDAPEHRPVQPPELGEVLEFSDIGGLQRHYERRAA